MKTYIHALLLRRHTDKELHQLLLRLPEHDSLPWRPLRPLRRVRTGSPAEVGLQHDLREHDIAARNTGRVKGGDSQMERVSIWVDEISFYLALKWLQSVKAISYKAQQVGTSLSST